jgi:hypothetical protein
VPSPSARRYVVAWWQGIQRAYTTETLRSLRSSMLSWGRGSAGSSKPPAAAPRDDTSEDNLSDRGAEGTLLAGAAAMARRRYAIKIKRKSKLAFRLLRFVILGHRFYVYCKRNKSKTTESYSQWNVIVVCYNLQQSTNNYDNTDWQFITMDEQYI